MRAATYKKTPDPQAGSRKVSPLPQDSARTVPLDLRTLALSKFSARLSGVKYWPEFFLRACCWGCSADKCRMASERGISSGGNRARAGAEEASFGCPIQLSARLAIAEAKASSGMWRSHKALWAYPSQGFRFMRDYHPI